MNDPETSSSDEIDDTQDSDSPDAGSGDGQSVDEAHSESASEAVPESQPEGDLPGWEPLTPELVEDEAIRGDFMLRWAVILLALLMGWTVIQDSSVLTHIKSGQAIAAEGYWPPGTDALSATAGQRRWVNLSWLWDVSIAGVYGMTGMWGVSLLKAVLAALTFGLLARVSLPGLPTWWGSVCGALALVAAFPSLTATPAVITLLGMAVLLIWLDSASRLPEKRPLWTLLVLMMVWNQFDDRAWIGLATLLVFAVGHWFDVRQSSDQTPGGATYLLKAAAMVAAVMLIHPFLWESLRSPLVQYQLEYPTLQAYAIRGEAFSYERFPIWAPEYWTVSYFNGAGMLLWLAAAVTLVLNGNRARVSHLMVFAFATVIACCGGRELAVAGLINAAVATLNAQEWYRESFRQTYSVETAELLFSRGGRAITVIALFALGFSFVSGHLTGADGRRVGMGLDPQIQQEIVSYENVLADSFDRRSFNFRLEQGDLLNWLGRHPFIDSRVRLFAAGSPSLVDEHLEIRLSLRISRSGADPTLDRDVWQRAFDKYGITHVLPRLSGNAPDYGTFRDLIASPDWSLTKLGAATAAFYRTDAEDAELGEFVAENQVKSLIDEELRLRDPVLNVTENRTTWPQPPSVYDKYMYLPRQSRSNALQQGRHYFALVSGLQGNVTVGEVVAAMYAAIRHVHRGLAENPNDRLAYFLLGEAYRTLWGIEQSIMQSAGVAYPASVRSAQTTSAFYRALTCDPGDSESHLQLFRLFAEQQRHDLALHHLQQFQEITGQITSVPESHPNYINEYQQTSEYLTSQADRVAEVRQQLADDLAAGADRILLAQSLTQSGFPLLALETIEGDITSLAGKPAAAQLYGRLLLEVGRTRDAYDQFQKLESIPEVQQLPDWGGDVADSELAAEDLSGALTSLSDEYELIANSSAALMTRSGPLHAVGLRGTEINVDPLPPVVQRTRLVSAYFDQLLPRLEMNALRRALIQLELGRNEEAHRLLEGILQQNPSSGFRPVVEFYRMLLSEPGTEPLELPPDEEANTIADLVGEPAPEAPVDDTTRDSSAIPE